MWTKHLQCGHTTCSTNDVQLSGAGQCSSTVLQDTCCTEHTHTSTVGSHQQLGSLITVLLLHPGWVCAFHVAVCMYRVFRWKADTVTANIIIIIIIIIIMKIITWLFTVSYKNVMGWTCSWSLRKKNHWQENVLERSDVLSETNLEWWCSERVERDVSAVWKKLDCLRIRS